MQQPNWSTNARGNRVVALTLALLVVGSVFAATAAAVPAMGFRGADVSETSVVVGENVTVSATVVNVGDSGGGYTFEFERNGSDFAEQRVQVPANEDRTVTETVRFDAPGTYRISVNDNRAGVVSVVSSRARVVSERNGTRQIDVRANGVSETSATAFDVAATNQSLALQQWSTVTGQSAFQQDLTEYSNASAAPVPVPGPEESTLVGLVTVDTVDGFEEGRMRLAVNESVLEDASLQRGDVTIYQRNGSAWERLETSAVGDTGERVVFEATATRATAYAVGGIDASVSVSSTTIRSAPTPDGQRLTLDGVLANDGPVAGEYDATLFVNGEEVNQTSVTVPAAGQTAVSLSYDLSTAGTYSLALNEESAGQVIISESQLRNTPSGEQDAGESATAPSVADDGGPTLPAAVPATVLGVDTLYLGGGLAIALGAFVVILLVLRRGDSGGGSGGSGGSGGFDPF